MFGLFKKKDEPSLEELKAKDRTMSELVKYRKEKKELMDSIKAKEARYWELKKGSRQPNRALSGLKSVGRTAKDMASKAGARAKKNWPGIKQNLSRMGDNLRDVSMEMSSDNRTKQNQQKRPKSKPKSESDDLGFDFSRLM